MTERIIDLVPLLDGDRDLLVLERLFGRPIERGSANFQCAGNLAFAVGAIGPTELMGQFHLLGRF